MRYQAQHRLISRVGRRRVTAYLWSGRFDAWRCAFTGCYSVGREMGWCASVCPDEHRVLYHVSRVRWHLDGLCGYRAYS